MVAELPNFGSLTVAVDRGRSVSARVYRALEAGTHASPASREDAAGDVSRPLAATFGLAHGAGAGQQSAFMIGFARGLSARGLDVVTFDFSYIEARRRVPDSNAVLEATWRAVVRATAERPEHEGHQLFVGGKSMGGRIASQVAAQAESMPAEIDGLVLLGYPLHPPNRPDRRRDAHLGRIRRPMLFVQGERDTFGNGAEMRTLIAGLPGAELHVVEGANHSLEPPKRAAVRREAVFGAIQDEIAAWIGRLLAARPAG
jgi:predicted alpha/beta-hydrolase family hydrolase